MKKFQLILLVAFTCFVVVVFRNTSARKKKLYKASLSAEVILVEKGIKGNYHIKVIEKGKLRYLGIRPATDTLPINLGDSVFKKSNSDLFYIKKRETTILIKPDWDDIYIGGPWED